MYQNQPSSTQQGHHSHNLLDDIQIPKNESTEYIDNMIIAMSHAKEDVNVAFARDYKNREESYG